MDQEELFIVLAGTAAFETMDGTITVDTGEAIRFAPGEFHSGANAANEELVALAVGVPRAPRMCESRSRARRVTIPTSG